MTRLRMGLASTMHPELNRHDDFLRLEALVGRLDARRSYEMGGIPASFAQSVAWPDTLLKVASCWSFKPDLAAFARGDLDDAFGLFLASIPARHRMWIAMNHEPEGRVDLADWNAANIRMADLIHGVTGAERGRSPARANLHSAVCLQGWTFNKASGRNPADYQPAIEACDLLALDPYGLTYYDPLGPGQPIAARAWLDGVGLTDKRISVWETSASGADPGKQAMYIRGLGDWCAANGVLHYIGFNSDVGGSTPIVDGTPEGRIAFTSLVEDFGLAANR